MIGASFPRLDSFAALYGVDVHLNVIFVFNTQIMAIEERLDRSYIFFNDASEEEKGHVHVGVKEKILH
jgi:hypothetical protein